MLAEFVDWAEKERGGGVTENGQMQKRIAVSGETKTTHLL